MQLHLNKPEIIYRHSLPVVNLFFKFPPSSMTFQKEFKFDYNFSFHSDLLPNDSWLEKREG